MSNTFESINISDIQLDEKNPRFTPVSNQKEAINVMFNELGDKLYELAKDITKHGLDPSKRLIVFKEKGKYIDGDGNRRVTVLKALETPDLISIKKYRDKFSELSKAFKKRKVEKVDCAIFSSRNDINHWLEINHGGEQDGRGQITWDSEQKQRFLGEKSIGLLAKERLLKEGKITEKEFQSANITTLDRLLSSKPGKTALSISSASGNTAFNDIESLEKIYKALIGKSVKEVYHDDDRKTFLLNVLGSLQPRDSATTNAPNIKNKRNQKTRRTSTKNEIIFGEVLNLKKSIVNDIYLDICNIYELHTSSGQGYVEILGFSLRLILDVAAHEYYKLNPVEGQHQDDLYKQYIKLLKKSASNKQDKASLGIDVDINNLIDENNLEAFLAKLAHGSVRTDISMILRLSKIIGHLLKIHFSTKDDK
ncbi:MAG: hypothetical protein Q7T88_08635 [Methylotenera sp.]|nr:hypothetical protein [Methylotenera sp.]